MQKMQVNWIFSIPLLSHIKELSPFNFDSSIPIVGSSTLNHKVSSFLPSIFKTFFLEDFKPFIITLNSYISSQKCDFSSLINKMSYFSKMHESQRLFNFHSVFIDNTFDFNFFVLVKIKISGGNYYFITLLQMRICLYCMNVPVSIHSHLIFQLGQQNEEQNLLFLLFLIIGSMKCLNLLHHEFQYGHQL